MNLIISDEKESILKEDSKILPDSARICQDSAADSDDSRNRLQNSIDAAIDNSKEDDSH